MPIGVSCVTTSESPPEPIEKDAEQLEEKYESNADVYAETRSEAAQISGDQAARDHWEEVVETLRKRSDDGRL